jgi:hypothetical protein
MTSNQPSPSAAAWHRIPYKLMLAVIAFSLAVEEFYPFSWFPMFTNLQKSTWYVFLKDGDGNVLPLENEFGWTGDRADNYFKANLSRLRKRHPELGKEETTDQIASKMLRHLLLVNRRSAKKNDEDRVLELWRTDVRLRDGSLVASDRLVGRMSRSEALALEAAGAPLPDTGPDGDYQDGEENTEGGDR